MMVVVVFSGVDAKFSGNASSSDHQDHLNCHYAGPNCKDCVALPRCGWCVSGNDAPSCVDTVEVKDVKYGERLAPSHPADQCKRWVLEDASGCGGKGDYVHPEMHLNETEEYDGLPRNDAECKFDWSKFKCEHSDTVCEYRYHFGVMSPSTSCRHISTREKHHTPKTDGECHWDVGGARCADQDVCEYRYEFGDLTLGQSCRMKVKRPPRSDEECGWDASKAHCDWPELCEYRYELGDLNLGQSCRLKKRTIPKTDKECKWDYSSAKCDFPQFCEYHYWIGDLTLDQSCVLIGSRDDHDKTPTKDEECTWSYKDARCAHPEVCSYLYHFGDLTLGQSCRLTANHVTTYDGPKPERDGDCDWDYSNAHCAWPDVCSFQYKFGDLTLGASCRTTVRGEVDTPGKSEEIPHSDEECDWSYTESRCEHPEKCMYKLCVGDMTLDQSCRYRQDWENTNRTCSQDPQDKLPVDDSECVWDYSSGACKFPEVCKYHYCFGDMTLDQSCRYAVEDRTCNDTKYSKYSGLADIPSRDDDCSWDASTAECTHPRFCEYRYCAFDVTLSQSCRLRRNQEQCASDSSREEKERNAMQRARNARLQEAQARRLRMEKRANEERVVWERVQAMLKKDARKKKFDESVKKYEHELDVVGWREKVKVLDRRAFWPNEKERKRKGNKPRIDSVLSPMGVVPEQSRRQKVERVCANKCLTYDKAKDLWQGCVRDCLFPPEDLARKLRMEKEKKKKKK